MRWIYLILAVVGTLLPYGAFLPWLIDNGPDLWQLIKDATVNSISVFAWLDVAIAAVALILFIVNDSRKHNVKYGYLAIMATLTIGVSAGLPLYLFLRHETEIVSQRLEGV
ncbi:DUF2834 domain-containing protein [Veronia pacifica]|uniref:DUF2834 domain-containing protein n=1 Tax=Veronia pacifica TaxID=1080227 RepID=A0A1C3ESE1_9GAMM|nr:DUF2834 domain-containing protein [Veronia pacifica]ODA36160.1 hypothetical protein A8L45_00730 [Veronia pacifica]